MSGKKGEKTSKLDTSRIYINEGYQPLGKITLTPETLPKTPSAVSSPKLTNPKGQEGSGSSSSESKKSE
jgi:hypothetical protein